MHSTSECYKNGEEDKRVTVFSAVEVRLWKVQPLGCTLIEKLTWQDFLSIPVLLKDSALKFITAQQFWLVVKGRRRKTKRRKERRWRSSRASPASPGTCPGQQLQLLLWRKSQPSLATSHLSKVSSPLPSPLATNLLFNSVFFSFDTLLLELISGCKSYKLLAYQVVSKGAYLLASSVLWVVSSVFTPPNGKSVKLRGVNMWALQGLKYHPLPGKQRWCRQPCRLVTSLFFDPPTFLQGLIGRQGLRIHSGHACTMSNGFSVYHHCQRETRPAKKTLLTLPPPTIPPFVSIWKY